MTLPQIRLLKEQTQTTPTLLLDDPAAEPDGTHLQRFVDSLRRHTGRRRRLRRYCSVTARRSPMAPICFIDLLRLHTGFERLSWT